MQYGRNVYRAGEEFTASAPDAKTLVLIGLATRADDEVPTERHDQSADVQAAASPEVTTRDLVAVEPERKKRGRPPKGAYLRRDMRAEK